MPQINPESMNIAWTEPSHPELDLSQVCVNAPELLLCGFGKSEGNITAANKACPEFDKFIAEALPEEEYRESLLVALAPLVSEWVEIQKPPFPERRA